jgi:hypothetical protein
MLVTTFKPLLSLSYWFSSYPGPLTGIFFWLVAGFILAGLAVGLGLRLAAIFTKDQSYRRLTKRLSVSWVTISLLFGLSFFFTQTATPILGSRFWFVLWLLVGLIWWGFIMRYAWRILPQERLARAATAANLRYLPRSK